MKSKKRDTGMLLHRPGSILLTNKKKARTVTIEEVTRMKCATTSIWIRILKNLAIDCLLDQVIIMKQLKGRREMKAIIPLKHWFLFAWVVLYHL